MDPSETSLAFSSGKSLIGYDNEQAVAGECEAHGTRIDLAEAGACREVFLCDAQAGTLACASCNPTGARPVGPSGLRTEAGASFVEYRPRQLLEGGTLFFDSNDALVANASGGQEDVYEYEGGRVLPRSRM